MRLRFADVTFDGEGRRLLRSGEPVHLTPKAYALLELLLQKRPAAVARADIQEALWPGVFVTEGNIDSLVKEIRRAFGDGGGDGPLLRTVHGFGYAFDGAVHEETVDPTHARHVVVWGVQAFPLGEGRNILGRAREATVWIGHDSVSRSHARVTVDGDRAEIVDAGSRNGTFLRGVRLAGPELLRDGDEIGLGVVRLAYRFLGSSPSMPTRPVG